MKVLNLYAGIGGNRKLWEDVEVTAVEIVPEIAAIYQDFFPDDKVIIGDAHQYLLDHYKEFDFIWSSPPCITHSRFKEWAIKIEKQNPVYPDLVLYEEIIFLEKFCKSKWCVENVIGYYNPLIRPQNVGRHYFWANFLITDKYIPSSDIQYGTIDDWERISGFDLSKYTGIDKRAILRSCVNPILGKHVLDCARGNTQVPLTKFSEVKVHE